MNNNQPNSFYPITYRMNFIIQLGTWEYIIILIGVSAYGLTLVLPIYLTYELKRTEADKLVGIDNLANQLKRFNDKQELK